MTDERVLWLYEVKRANRWQVADRGMSALVCSVHKVARAVQSDVYP